MHFATLSNTLANTPIDVPVTIEVSEPSEPGELWGWPSALIFAVDEGTTDLMDRTVALAANGGGAREYAVSGPNSTWVSTSTVSYLTPTEFQVTVDPAGMTEAESPYTDTVTLVPVDGGTPFSLEVLVYVNAVLPSLPPLADLVTRPRWVTLNENWNNIDFTFPDGNGDDADSSEGPEGPSTSSPDAGQSLENSDGTAADGGAAENPQQMTLGPLREPVLPMRERPQT